MKPTLLEVLQNHLIRKGTGPLDFLKFLNERKRLQRKKEVKDEER